MAECLFNADVIKNAGWRQGSFVRVEDHEIIVPCQNNTTEKDIRYVILSQSCDVVNSSIEKEPYVELIIAKQIVKLDGQYKHARNPRKLHISALSKNFEFNAHGRCFLSRKYLSCITPDEIILDDNAIDLLTRWIAARYTRVAFPDNFNDRVRMAGKKLIKKLKALDFHGVIDLFIAGSELDKELEPDKPYNIALLVALLDDSSQNEIGAYSILEELVEELNKVDIIVQEYQVEKESHFSYKDLRKMYRWSWEYISWAGSGLVPYNE